MTDEQKKLFVIDKLNIKRSEIPAVTHVDSSARIQSVTKETNKHYYDLIEEFYKQTGVPILFNTSFNLAGEPLVETLEDAMDTVKRSAIDLLVYVGH